MASRLKRTVLRPIPYLFSDRVGLSVTKLGSRSLIDEFRGNITDKSLEFLLGGMDLAFCLLKGYRKNIKDFRGKYLFRTTDDVVAASAIFEDGDMQVHKEAIYDWDVRITYKDVDALWKFILSRDNDILQSILKNDVEADGNLNYVYKFVFMVRDLAHRFGIE